MFHVEVISILSKYFSAILKKVGHFVLTNLLKMLKNSGSKKGKKNLFSLLNLSQMYKKMILFDLAKYLKFDLNRKLWK